MVGVLLDVTVGVTDFDAVGEPDTVPETVTVRDAEIDTVAENVGSVLTDATLEREALSLDVVEMVGFADEVRDGDPVDDGLADTDALGEMVGGSDMVGDTLAVWLLDEELETDPDSDGDEDGLDDGDEDFVAELLGESVGSGDGVEDRECDTVAVEVPDGVSLVVARGDALFVGEPEDDLLSDGDLLDVTVVVTDLVAIGEPDLVPVTVVVRDADIETVVETVGLGLVVTVLDREDLSLGDVETVGVVDLVKEGDPDGDELPDTDGLGEIDGWVDVVADSLGEWLLDTVVEADPDVDVEGDELGVGDGDFDDEELADADGDGVSVGDGDPDTELVGVLDAVWLPVFEGVTVAVFELDGDLLDVTVDVTDFEACSIVRGKISG